MSLPPKSDLMRRRLDAAWAARPADRPMSIAVTGVEVQIAILERLEEATKLLDQILTQTTNAAERLRGGR